MRYQIIFPNDLYFDLKNYAEDNGMKPQDIVRQLVRREIYFTHYFCRPITDKKKAKKIKRTNYPSDRLADL